MHSIKSAKKQLFLDIHNKLQYIHDETNELDKYLLETDLNNKISRIYQDNEIFWDEMAWIKDIFSYKFNNRKFAGDQKPKTNEINVDALKIKAQLPAENIPADKPTIKVNMKDTYDIRGSIAKTLARDYVDEGNSIKDKYHLLEPFQYYELVRLDVMECIFITMYKCKLYSSMLLLYCGLVTSRELFHFAFNDVILEHMFNAKLYAVQTDDVNNVVQYINPFLDEHYLSLIHRCLFYGIYLLYKEECVLKAKVTLMHRHVLRLKNICKIPNFHGDIHKNPFIPLTIAPKFLQNEGIIKPINMNITGLYSETSFWSRFDVFTENIFNGLNQDKIYFGGSVIMACTNKTSNELLFNIDLKTDAIYDTDVDEIETVQAYWHANADKLEQYFDEYYPSKKVLTNSTIFNPDAATFSADNMAEIEDLLSDIDVKIDVLKDDEFDIIANQIYECVCRNVFDKNININQTPLSTLDDSSCVRLLKIRTSKSYKYYISGWGLKRSIEIFRFYGAHPMGGVSRYHFPCVRGMTNRNNVYILPSLLCYANTGLFVDYKWIACETTSMELILKYWVRGGTLIMNQHEQEQLMKYIMSNPEWHILYQYHNNQTKIDINNPVFKPRLYQHAFYNKIGKYLAANQIPDAIISHNNYQYVLANDNQFIDEMSNGQWNNEKNMHSMNKYGYDDNLRFESGHIKPVYLWQILAYIHDLINSKKYV